MHFARFDTKLCPDYIGLRRLSGLIGLVWGKTGAKWNEAREHLSRTLAFAGARVLTSFAFRSPLETEICG